MRRAILLSVIIYTLVLVGLGTLQGPMLAFAIPFIVYLLVGFFNRPEKLEVTAIRNVAVDRITRGQPFTATLTLVNNGTRLEEVYLKGFAPPKLTLQEGEERLLTRMDAGEVLNLVHTFTGLRGYHELSGMHLIAIDTFNLFHQETPLKASAPVYVLPETVPIKNIVIRPRRTKAYSGQVPARLGGPGIEFYGVRNYELGDPPRWIDWKTSARYEEQLFTKMFEQERVADVGLILDARLRSDVARNGNSLFEHSIDATAMLAQAFLNQGNRVGLLLYGSYLDWTFPGYGRIQRERILQSLAQAQQGESQVFGNLEFLPTRFFPSKSQVVLISPLLREDIDRLLQLPVQGYQLMVVSPDPVSYERSLLPDSPEINLAYRIARAERQLLLGRLRAAGIMVLDWQVDVPFKLVAQTALSRIPRWFRSAGVGL